MMDHRFTRGGQNGEIPFKNNFISLRGFLLSAIFLLAWWLSKVRSGYSWCVSLRTFDWQSAELLSAKKAAAVCLACAKTLYVDHFPGIFWLEIGASATFLETSSRRSMCQGHLCWMSVSVESQHFDLPPNWKGVSNLSLITFLGKHAEITL